jgi:hypothetical protein
MEKGADGPARKPAEPTDAVLLVNKVPYLFSQES